MLIFFHTKKLKTATLATVVDELIKKMEVVTEEEVLEAITFRESLITRCQRIVEISSKSKTNLNGITARELVNLANELRISGLLCVQKIVAWTLSNTDPHSSEPSIFLWNETEYLCKMLTDLDFIYESLNTTMKQHGGFGLQ